MMKKIWAIIAGVGMLTASNQAYGSGGDPHDSAVLMAVKLEEIAERCRNLQTSIDKQAAAHEAYRKPVRDISPAAKKDVRELTEKFECRLSERVVNWALEKLNGVVHIDDPEARMQGVMGVVKRCLREELLLPDYLEFLQKMLTDILMVHINNGGWGRSEVRLARTIWEWRETLISRATIRVNCGESRIAWPSVDTMRKKTIVCGEQYGLWGTSEWITESEKYQLKGQIQESRDEVAKEMLRQSGNSGAYRRLVAPFGDYAIGVAPTFMAYNDKDEPIRLVLTGDTGGRRITEDPTFNLRVKQGILSNGQYGAIATTMQWIYHLDPVLRGMVMNFVESDKSSIGEEAYGLIEAMRTTFEAMESGRAWDTEAYMGTLYNAFREVMGQITESVQDQLKFLQLVERCLHRWYGRILNVPETWEGSGSAKMLKRIELDVGRERTLMPLWCDILDENFTGMLEENTLFRRDHTWRSYWRAVGGISECKDMIDGDIDEDEASEGIANDINEWKNQSRKKMLEVKALAGGDHPNAHYAEIIQDYEYRKRQQRPDGLETEIMSDVIMALESMAREILDTNDYDEKEMMQIFTERDRMSLDWEFENGVAQGFDYVYSERAIEVRGFEFIESEIEWATREKSKYIGRAAVKEKGGLFELPAQLLISQSGRTDERPVPMEIHVTDVKGANAMYVLKTAAIKARDRMNDECLNYLISRDSGGRWMRANNSGIVRIVTDEEASNMMNGTSTIGECTDIMLTYIKWTWNS
jgi:hypothetical protein